MGQALLHFLRQENKASDRVNTELRTTSLQTITLDGSALSPVTSRDKGHEVTDSRMGVGTEGA